MATGDVVFFDIGETLGAVYDEPGAPVPHLQAFSYAPPVLERLKADGVLLGVISHTGVAEARDVDGMLEHAGLLRYFHPDLRIYSSVVKLRKDSSAIFELATGRALRVLARPLAGVVFVGESRAERNFAVDGGMNAAPHPLLAHAVLAGGRPIYLLLRVRRDDVARLADLFASVGVVPLRRTDAGADTEIVGLSTDRGIAQLQAGGVTVEVLPGSADAVSDDLYLLRGLPRAAGPAAFAALVADGLKPVHETPDGTIVALAPHQVIDDFHIGDGHGHNLKLLGDPTLLFRRAPPPVFASQAFAAATFADTGLAPEELATLAATITEQRFEQVLRFVTGMDGRAGAVGGNRHVASWQMRAVTDGLIAEFQRIGHGTFKVTGHRFEITGSDVRDVSGTSVPKRIELYNVIAELPGETDEVVLVTAHLDSTAVGTFRSAYDPAVHDAPGVDDDGSGVAAVLLIAEFMRAVFGGRRRPARTLRFVLFNAEEQGLIGSARYARAQAAAGANIAAVFQMDMIAYNSSEPNNFEIHAGTSTDTPTPADADVERASLSLADLIRRVAAYLAAEGLSILAPAQVFASPDPAAGRSDHGSFHNRGYAAIAASEDFFPAPGSPADGNPNYHLASDRVFDLPFATSLARVICAAALRTTQPAAEPAFAAAAAFAPASGANVVQVSGRLVTSDDAPAASATIALRVAGVHAAGTAAEATTSQDGSFTLHAPPGHYHVVARASDGAPLVSTHETPFAVEAGRPLNLVLRGREATPLIGGAPDARRAVLFADMTLDAKAVSEVTPEEVLDMARALVAPATHHFDTRFAAPSSATHSINDSDDPMHTLCGTERLRKLDRLAELQGYVDPAIVKAKVRNILAMGESGFAAETYVTPNFVISYQTDGPAAVENDLSDFDVIEPGSNPPRVIETLPGGTVPVYVRLVAFWLERSLQFYTSPPFAMRNPAAEGRLSAFINTDQFGSALPDGFYINNELPPELVCAVAVHELFHMVQYSYDGPGPWRAGVFEGGATFAEDTVADLMNRYLDEAGHNFNGMGLLAKPNQSLFAQSARYKSSLFWRYLAEQRSRLVDGPTIGVDTYRRVIEECAENGYSTASVKRAIRSLPFDAELCTFGYSAGMADVPANTETTFGNFALACYLKDLATPPDARFGFRENEENIHIDDVVRLVIADAPSAETLVRVKRERGRLTGGGPKVVFQDRVEPLASVFFEVEVAADVDSIDVSFTAGASFAGLVQVAAIEESGMVRDIVRSDKRVYGRRFANALSGGRLSTLLVVVSGGEGGGSVQVSLQPAAPMADVMITRWNSESGREYHLDPHGAAWTWVSPDLWFEPAAGGDFVVKVRVHNKGNKAAEDVSCALAYRPGTEPGAGAPWLPVLDATGAVQRIKGERIEAGAAREFSLPWKPAQIAPDGIFSLRAEVACADDANPDNNTALSRLGIALADKDDVATLIMTPALARRARDGALAAVARPRAASRTLFGLATERAPGLAMLRAALPPSTSGFGRTVAGPPRARDSDDPARRTLPGTLAMCPAITMRLSRPDGSLEPGATMFFVKGDQTSASFFVARGAQPALAPTLLASRAPLTRSAAGLFASEFWTITRHEAIAAAAEPHLNQKAREAIARITAPLGDGFEFSRLAGWADTVKRRQPRPGDDADTVAFLNDARNKANDTWHYVNLPCQADGYDRVKYPRFTRDDDVVQMTAAAVRVLMGSSDRFSPLSALRLLIHLVGDVHQPIHVGGGYIDSSTQPPRLVLDPQVATNRKLPHDRGGGRLFLPTGGNLHSYWDGSLSSIGAAGDGGNDEYDHDHDHEFAAPKLKARLVQKLLDMTTSLPPAAAGFFTLDSPDRWAERWATDSLMAAREAYVSLRITEPKGNDFKVSWEGKPGYDARCKPIANARLSEAVRNLAALLNRILG